MSRTATPLRALLFLLLIPGAAASTTAPTTPTFVLSWGNIGQAPAQFSQPFGVAADALGNVYVADQNNSRIQKFDRLGNFIIQWGSAGSGNGQFNFPLGIATNAAGNVYVADTYNHRIQKFSSSGAYLAQWGSNGSGNGQFNLPIDLATDAAGNVYVTELINHRIQKFTGAGAYLTQWGTNGSGNGQFNAPFGVATDAAGNVYVADQNNYRIQKFTSAGAYLTQWGTNGSGNGQFNYPLGVATDAAGNVYVTENFNNRVQKFTATGTYLTQWGSAGTGNGQFDTPVGVEVDAAGNLYVADSGNNRMQKFSGAGAALSEPPAAFLLKWGTIGSGNGQFQNAYGVTTDAAGNIFVADVGNNRIQKFSATGAYLTQWGAFGSGNGQFSSPYGVATDGAGNVYVADGSNSRVQKFSSAGFYITQWGTLGSGSGQFNNPIGVATDAAGNVYVVEQFNHRVQKFTGSGAYLAQWGTNGSGNGQFANPAGLAADASGNVYVADLNNSRIQKFVSPPAIALVSDVRNDQGRQAQIRFLRASGDASGTGVVVTGYEIYRRNDPLLAAAGTAGRDAAAVSDISSRPVSLAGVQLAGWTYLMTAPAHGESEYNVVVPTLVDATAASLEYSGFMVRAATGDPLTFYDSGVDDGFSVDNLSPPAPGPFTAAYTVGATHLHWGVSTASDFATFHLYRGASADFAPGPSTLVTATSDTGYVDTGAAGSYYKLAAVDWNGNESPYALVGPGQTTDVPESPVVAFALDGARPSPAIGGRIMVHFALPNGEPARLELIDVTGRRVREHAVGTLGAGRHAVDLAEGARLKPGLYFIRLTQGARTAAARAMLLN